MGSGEFRIGIGSVLDVIKPGKLLLLGDPEAKSYLQKTEEDKGSYRSPNKYHGYLDDRL